MMRLFFSYARLEFMRCLKKIPLIIFFTAVFFCVAMTASYVFSSNMNFSSGDSGKYKVAIAGNMNDPYLMFAQDALSRLDSSNKSIELYTMSKDEAERELKKNKISAYVLVPDGFTDSVNNGLNDVSLEFVTTVSAAPLEGMVRDEILGIISRLLIQSQSGIFTMQHFVRKSFMRTQFERFTYDLNLKYVDWVLSRSGFASVNERGFSQKLSAASYYFCSILVFFLMSFSVAFSFFFTGQSASLKKLLKMRGLLYGLQILAEYISYFIVLYASFLLCLFFAGAASFFNILKLDLWARYGSSSSLLSMACQGIFVCLMISSLHVFLYEFFTDGFSAVLASSSFVIALCWLGGVFYPVEFFPDEVQFILLKLPTSVALSAFSSALKEEQAIVPLLFLYSALFILFSIFVRHLKKGEA